MYKIIGVIAILIVSTDTTLQEPRRQNLRNNSFKLWCRHESDEEDFTIRWEVFNTTQNTWTSLANEGESVVVIGSEELFAPCVVFAGTKVLKSWDVQLYDLNTELEDVRDRLDETISFLERLETDQAHIAEDVSKLRKDEILSPDEYELFRTASVFVDVSYPIKTEGSGTIVQMGDQLYVLTAAHVVTEHFKMSLLEKHPRQCAANFTGETLAGRLDIDLNRVYTHHVYDIALIGLNSKMNVLHIWDVSSTPVRPAILPFGFTLRTPVVYFLWGSVNAKNEISSEVFSDTAGMAGYSGTGFIFNNEVTAIHAADASHKLQHSEDSSNRRDPLPMGDEGVVIDLYTKAIKSQMKHLTKMSRNAQSELVSAHFAWEIKHRTVGQCPDGENVRWIRDRY